MLPRGSRRKRKKGSILKSVFLLAITAVLIISSGIWGGNGANAEYLVPMDKIPKLEKVGPIGDYGYPVWYRDSNNLRLELCLDGINPLCGFAVGDFPGGPLNVKTGNFPEEAFYQLASATIALPSGGDADAVFALEAAWANELVQDGDQIVFGRVRFRVDDLITGSKYIITHPYGKDEIVATAEDKDDPLPGGPGEIRFVEDIGINGGFEGARTSRIGTFLEWDTTEDRPIGYVGDPRIDHKIKNGFHNGTEEQNYFRIQGPGINSTCVSGAQTIQNCIQTDLFSLMGKVATTAGVDVMRATYSEDTTGGGTIDVFASTEEDKEYTIDVTGAGMSATTMRGTDGQYFGRLTFTGDVPAEITVTNKSDIPVSTKKLKPVDHIIGTAKYDTNSDTLFISASSSDKLNPPTLTAKGFGDIPATGTLVVNNPAYIPPNITVTSSAKGSESLPVNVTADPAIANPGEAQTVKQGDLVTLDGGASINAANYKWEQVSGPEVQLDLANPAKPTFTFPKKFIPVSFKLTVTGNDGKSSTNEAIVTINPDPNILKTTEVYYAKSTNTLVVKGTSDVPGPEVNVTVLVGTQSYSTNVLADGTWTLSNRGGAYKEGNTINIISNSGGKLTNVPVSIRTR